jgi:predicted nucleic acid-binding protein
MCLIDTSAWVEALRVDGDSEVRQRVAAHLSDGSACLTEMVLLELWNGARGERERRELSRLESSLTILETGQAVWYLAWDLARLCRSRGATVPATDLLVYACGRHHEAEIEHCDEHFEMIRRVESGEVG